MLAVGALRVIEILRISPIQVRFEIKSITYELHKVKTDRGFNFESITAIVPRCGVNYILATENASVAKRGLQPNGAVTTLPSASSPF